MAVVPGALRFSTDKPCASCPYRRDATPKLWHRSEFEGVARNDHPFGALYACHKYRNRRDRASVCAGWLLDQKRRGVPNLVLRIVLSNRSDARALFERVSSGGASMFRSIGAMLRANGVRTPRVKAPEQEGRRCSRR